MGEILLYWIENKLGLDLPYFQDPKKLRKAMSNGYLIGEILRKYNVISDDQCISLRKTLTNKCCVKNMQYLHKWLRDSGLNADFQELLAIVEEEPGAAMRFIYRLYLWLESPRCFTIAGFKPMSSLKKYLRDIAIGEQDLTCFPKSPGTVKVEFKPWESLGDRNRQAMEAGDEVQYVSEPRPQIYYDVPLQPPVLLNVKNYSGMTESQESDELYFDFQTFKKTPPTRTDWKKEIPVLCRYTITPNAAKENSRAVAEQNREKELQNSMNEMKEFNEEVQHTLDKPLMSVKVYENGCGDYTEYRATLHILRRRAQEERRLTQERDNYRKTLTCQIQQANEEEMVGEFEEDIFSRVSVLPSREKNLAEFITGIHANKQGFLDHMVYEQGQLAELRGEDQDKQYEIIEQQEKLHKCLLEENFDFNRAVECEMLLAQQKAAANKSLNDVDGILNNLLDYVIKIATYKEAAKVDPPEPLIQDWKEEFHKADEAMENQAEGIEAPLSYLDDANVKDYLFLTGSWKLDPFPDTLDPLFTENYILKKLVSLVLEKLFPPPPPEPPLPVPLFGGAAIVTGLNFHWKPTVVWEKLVNVTEKFPMQILDVTLLLQEAIRTYSAALVARKLQEERLLQELQGEYEAEEEEGGDEFRTIWSRASRVAKPITDEQESIASPLAMTEDGKVAAFDPTARRKTEEYEKPKRRRSTRSKRGSTESRRASRKSVVLSGRRRSSKSQKRLSKGAESENDNSMDGKEITDSALEEAFSRKRKKSRRRSKKSVDVQYGPEPPDHSQTYDIVKNTLATPKVDASTIEDVQTLFSPQDQPETWPEFVKLGQTALQQILTGFPVSDDLIANLIVERMRHYPPNAFVVILNYPHALCQALSLENAIKPNSLQRPPCYHHADVLIEEFKRLAGPETGRLIQFAGEVTAEAVPKHRSRLFRYTDDDKYPLTTFSEPFQSFLDGFIIADIDQAVITRRTLSSLEVEQGRMLSAVEPCVQDKLDVLLRLAFHQLKTFYAELGLADLIAMDVEDEPYYEAMKDRVLQSIERASNRPPRNVLREYLGEFGGEDEGNRTNTASETEASNETKASKLKVTISEKSVGKKKKKGKGKKKKGGSGSNTSVKNKKKGKKKKKGKSSSRNLTSEEEGDEWSAEEEEMPSTPPATAWQSLNIYYHIPQDDLKNLGQFWVKMEDRYLRGIADALNELRSHHNRIHRYAIQFRSNFAEFLARPDTKQNLLTQFQDKYNQVSPYIRGDYEVKAELHNRVTELKERLNAICDERHDEAIQEMYNVLSEGYLEGEMEILTNLFITLIQLEADHYCDVIQFINDLYCMTGLVKPETLPWCDVLRVELISRSRFTLSVRQFASGENMGEEAPPDGRLSGLARLTGLEEPAKKVTSSLQVEPSRPNSEFLVGRRKSNDPQEKKLSTIKVPDPQGRVSVRGSTITSVKLNPGPVDLVKEKKKPSTAAAELIPVIKQSLSLMESPRRKSTTDATKRKPIMENAKEVMETEEEYEEEGAQEAAGVQTEEGTDSAPPSKRLLEGYFGNDEEDEDCLLKKSYQDTIRTNHEESLDFLKSIFTRVLNNLSNVEAYTMDFVKVAADAILAAEEKALEEELAAKASKKKLKKTKSKSKSKSKSASKSPSSTGSGKKKKKKGKKGKSPKSKESSRSSLRKKKSKHKHKSKSKSNSSVNDSDGKKKKGDKKKKKKKGGSSGRGTPKKGKSNKSLQASAAASGEALASLQGIAAGLRAERKRAGTKRLMEWQQAVELEGKRMRLQLAGIDNKAGQELQRLKELLLQVVMAGEHDAAVAYKTEIQNVQTACDVFRFAIENGTSVDTDITLENASFLLGCSADLGTTAFGISQCPPRQKSSRSLSTTGSRVSKLGETILKSSRAFYPDEAGEGE